MIIRGKVVLFFTALTSLEVKKDTQCTCIMVLAHGHTHTNLKNDSYVNDIIVTTIQK